MSKDKKKGRAEQRVFLIGIAGPSGAGKTEISANLKKRNKSFEHIALDDYFKSPEKFPRKSGFVDWEVPSNIDFGKLFNHLRRLKRGEDVTAKYRFYWPKKKEYWVKIKPEEVIVVEGFLLFKDKRTRDILDLKIYLKASFDIALKRREEKFRRLGLEVEEYDRKVVLPEYKKWGVAQIKHADAVIDADRSLRKVEREVRRVIKEFLIFN